MDIPVDLHTYSGYTCVVGQGLFSTSRQKPVENP